MRILEILTEKRKVGNIGENAAVKFLKKNKFKIIERNYVAVNSEIDIIAENKTTVIFVEVKTRTLGHENRNEARPASSVTPEKQRKIIAAAKYFLGTYFEEKRVRFDIIEVYLDENKKAQKILHLESAFNYNTAHPKFSRF